ncbi:MAG: cyclic pyranopterin phosphate synthase [Myxococcota bacterium]|jgi:cyclic pyranopterin phosphate synthase
MIEKMIPIAENCCSNGVAAIASNIEAPVGLVTDALKRPLRDLRISVTDRCNLRCVYCMPKDVFDKGYVFLPKTSLLAFEEMARITRLAVTHGVEKIRLTGGEPLLRKKISRNYSRC